jgi:hypothetical protein
MRAQRTLKTAAADRHLSAAGATHRAESDTTRRNKGLATIVGGDGRLVEIRLGRGGAAVLGIGLGRLLPPAYGRLRVITGQAIGGILRAAGGAGGAAIDGRGTGRAGVVSGSSRGGDRCELWNDDSRQHTGRWVVCNGSSGRVVALLVPGGDPGW